MSSALTSRPLASRTRRRQVMSWLISRMARIGFSSVMSRSTTLWSSSMRSMIAVAPDLEEGGVLAHVGVADDDVQAAVALGVGVGLVAGVDDRAAAGGGRRHALPDVLGPLGDAVHRAPRRLQHLAGAGVDLAGDEERDEHLGVVGEVVAPAGEVVLVAAVAVAGRVGVVLEQVDDAADALLPQALLGASSGAARGCAPRPCRARRGRRWSRTRAWRTRGASRRRGRAGRRWPGTRWSCGPS